MNKIIGIIFLLLSASWLPSYANVPLHDINNLVGVWEGTSKIASGFGYLVDKAIMEVREVQEDRFIGTLTAIAPNGEHLPVITPLVGVVLPDGTIHASAGTGGILLMKLKHRLNGEWVVFGSSMSTVPPNEQFTFLPIASILEMTKMVPN